MTRSSAICPTETVTPSFASFPNGSRPTITNWRVSLCCWTTFTSRARSAPMAMSGRWERMPQISSRKCGRSITGTTTAYVAANDLALGQIVEAISHSKFWPQTAIFIVEDDAQNGPDHVDAHRTIAFVISPYAKRRVVDSTMYSTSSMLRTIELILGLQPMSQFDAAATPMFNSFQAKPDLQPYQTLPARVDIDEKNTLHAWGGDIKMNFAREDAADDLLLNEVIWRSVRGAKNPMPAPVRAAFVFSHPTDK